MLQSGHFDSQMRDLRLRGVEWYPPSKMTELGMWVLQTLEVLMLPPQDTTLKMTAWNRYLFSRRYSRALCIWTHWILTHPDEVITMIIIFIVYINEEAEAGGGLEVTWTFSKQSCRYLNSRSWTLNVFDVTHSTLLSSLLPCFWLLGLIFWSLFFPPFKLVIPFTWESLGENISSSLD